MGNKQPVNNNNEDVLRTYSILFSMGFDDDLSMKASHKFPKNVDNAVDYILKHQNKSNNKSNNQELKKENMHKEQNHEDSKTPCDSIENCLSIKRIKSVLVLYNDNMNNQSLMNMIANKMNEQYTITDILNDYIHVIRNHSDSDDNFEVVYNTLNIKCKMDECTGLRRNRRQARTKHDNHITQDIVDQIHTYFLHTFDTGHRLTRNEKQILSANNDEKNRTFKRIRDLLSHKRKRLSNVMGSEKETNHSKFVTQIDKNENDDADEKKESDNQSNVYSFSYRFNYWQHDKKLCITNKYDHLKQEILNNAISTLNVNEYDEAYSKALVYLATNRAKAITFQYRYNVAHKECGFYGIKIGEQMKVDHFMALILYTDYDTLSNHFSSTFRGNDQNKSMNELLQRHRNYYWFGRYLREAVEGYGDTIKNLQRKEYYHGISTPLIFPSVIAQFYHPTSTTKDIVVAQQFATNDGIIIKLTKHCNIYEQQYRMPLPCFDCEWFSRYAIEREVLFNGGLYMFEITDIINCATGQHFAEYLRALRLICRSTIGLYQGIIGIDSNDENNIRLLMERDNKVPKYILNLFNSYSCTYCHIRFVTLIEDSSYLASILLTNDKSPRDSFVNLKAIKLLLTNCTKIRIENKYNNVEPIRISTEYIQEIILQLIDTPWIELQKIVIAPVCLDVGETAESLENFIVSKKESFFETTAFHITGKGRNCVHISRESIE